MEKRNEYIRTLAKARGVRMWRVAERLGVTPGTLCRWLRYELTPGKRKAIIDVIMELSSAESEA